MENIQARPFGLRSIITPKSYILFFLPIIVCVIAVAVGNIIFLDILHLLESLECIKYYVLVVQVIMEDYPTLNLSLNDILRISSYFLKTSSGIFPLPLKFPWMRWNFICSSFNLKMT